MIALLLRCMVDFGLLTFIWSVQLVIYPSFMYFNKNDLLKWHPKYTQLVTYIVAPLLFMQTGLIAYQFLNIINFYSIASLILCGFCWLSTFFWAIPLHQQLENGNELFSTCKQLIQMNWLRTIAWSLLWILSFTQFILWVETSY